MNNPTYKEQFDKITRAYINDEIQPYDIEFCFCGTLSYKKDALGWWDTDFYCFQDLHNMEFELLNTIMVKTIGGNDIYIQSDLDNDNCWEKRDAVKNHSNYEDAVFEGMCKALDVLKAIHISKGEVIDEVPAFQKRKLSNVNA